VLVHVSGDGAGNGPGIGVADLAVVLGMIVEAETLAKHLYDRSDDPSCRFNRRKTLDQYCYRVSRIDGRAWISSLGWLAFRSDGGHSFVSDEAVDQQCAVSFWRRQLCGGRTAAGERRQPERAGCNRNDYCARRSHTIVGDMTSPLDGQTGFIGGGGYRAE
jgi:hypothetical protein